MANYIKPPLLDKTGKEIVAALTGEAVQPSASKINAPISDETGKAILNAIQQSGGGSGGANVLMLYAINVGTDNVKAYKNPELTEEYESFIEAFNAISNADIIKVVDTGVDEGQYTVNMALDIVAIPDTIVFVAINLDDPNANPLVPLWQRVEI